LQSDLAAAGIRVHLTVMSWATFITAIAARQGPPFSYISWIADYPDPSNFLDPKFRTPRNHSGATNDSFYTNPELDAVLDAARREPDRRWREAMYHRAERILYDDAPWIWDYHRATINVVQPYVQSYQAHPIWLHDFTAAWLDLGPDGAPVTR
jgi:peptide/nickel transport system substrate-binding protein